MQDKQQIHVTLKSCPRKNEENIMQKNTKTPTIASNNSIEFSGVYILLQSALEHSLPIKSITLKEVVDFSHLENDGIYFYQMSWRCNKAKDIDVEKLWFLVRDSIDIILLQSLWENDPIFDSYDVDENYSFCTVLKIDSINIVNDEIIIRSYVIHDATSYQYFLDSNIH